MEPEAQSFVKMFSVRVRDVYFIVRVRVYSHCHLNFPSRKTQCAFPTNKAAPSRVTCDPTPVTHCHLSLDFDSTRVHGLRQDGEARGVRLDGVRFPVLVARGSASLKVDDARHGLALEGDLVDAHEERELRLLQYTQWHTS